MCNYISRESLTTRNVFGLRASVCASVCLSAAACLHYCRDPDVTWGSGRGCPLVVHYWADLQPVHGLRCYGNITRRRNVSKYMCLYSLHAWLSSLTSVIAIEFYSAERRCSLLHTALCRLLAVALEKSRVYYATSLSRNK